MKKVLLAVLPAFLLAAPAFAQDKPETDAKPATQTGAKIWYVSPIKFTENGVGFELGYEHGLDAGGIVAYNLPLVATFNLAKNDINNGNKQDPMFYFMPGIKFYPTSSFGKVKYAIGPSLVIGAGQQTDNVYVSNYVGGVYTGSYTYQSYSKFLLGVTVNNSLNINPSPHFTLGLDFGFGFTYITKVDGNNQGIKGLVQGGFRMGYRL